VQDGHEAVLLPFADTVVELEQERAALRVVEKWKNGRRRHPSGGGCRTVGVGGGDSGRRGVLCEKVLCSNTHDVWDDLIGYLKELFVDLLVISLIVVS